MDPSTHALCHEAAQRSVPEILFDSGRNLDLLFRFCKRIIFHVAVVSHHGDLGNGVPQKKTFLILDPDLDVSGLSVYFPHPLNCGREPGQIEGRFPGVQAGGLKPDGGGRTNGAQNAPMPAGGSVTSRPGVFLLHFTRGKDLLSLQHDRANIVPSFFVCPYPGEDVIHRINDVTVAIIADNAMGSLGGIPGNGEFGVNQQVQPIGRPGNIVAALQPDGTHIITRAQSPLNGVGYFGKIFHPWILAVRSIGKKILSHGLRLNATGTDIGAVGVRKTLGIASGREGTKEVKIGFGTQQIGGSPPASAPKAAVDLLEKAGGIRKKGLPAFLKWGVRKSARGVPRRPISLKGHIG